MPINCTVLYKTVHKKTRGMLRTQRTCVVCSDYIVPPRDLKPSSTNYKRCCDRNQLIDNSQGKKNGINLKFVQIYRTHRVCNHMYVYKLHYTIEPGEKIPHCP